MLLVAAGNEPTATVTVDGVPLSYRDVLQLTGLSIGAGGEEAGLIAMLEAGKGDAALRRLYAQVENDPSELASLGAALTSAMSEMSDKTVQYSNDERRWIFRNVPAGTPWARAQDMLREHGLVADKHGDVMVVSLPGAFAPGCYFSTNVTLTFNQMRLYKTDLSQPIPDCL